MPMSNRPYEVEGNGSSRRFFRSPLPDLKRFPKQTRGAGRPTPPESTSAENFYYLKQMNAKTPMVIVMTDGEEIRGWIEWYDRDSIKVNREGSPNLMIRKQCIKYLFKEEELS